MKEKINTDVKKKLENINKHISDLTFDVGDIFDMYTNGELNEAEKRLFVKTLKTIVEKHDVRSIFCVGFFRDIMTDELYDYLLDQLKKCIYISEALALEIMKLITCDGFSEYYVFLESIKDNDKLTDEFRKFIKTILDFQSRKIECFSFPLINSDVNGENITIDW